METFYFSFNKFLNEKFKKVKDPKAEQDLIRFRDLRHYRMIESFIKTISEVLYKSKTSNWIDLGVLEILIQRATKSLSEDIEEGNIII